MDRVGFHRPLLQRVRVVLASSHPARLAGGMTAVVVSALALGLLAQSTMRNLSVDFLVTSSVVAVIPGTGVVYTVSSAFSAGWRQGSFAAVGCTLGIVPHVLAAMLGLSGVMQAGAAAFEVVRWAGVAYLAYMGLSMMRQRGTLQLEGGNDAGSATSMGLVVWRGVLLNLLNPKLTVFFFAFLPQFLDTPPGLLDTRLVGLGAVFMLVTLVVFAGYAWLSATFRDRVLGAPAVARWIQRSLGGLLLGSAVRLAVDDR